MKKRNKIIVIISAIMLVLALVFIILGFALSGYDILAWFGSKWAIWIYVIVGLWILFIAYVFIGDLIRKI